MPDGSDMPYFVHWLAYQLRRGREVSWYVSKGLYHRLTDDHVFLLAGGLSFSIFICIIPMILIVFSALGIMASQPSVVREIDAFIDKIIPYPEYAADVKSFVLVRIDEFKGFRGVAGILGVAGLFFAASGLFSSMRTILNKVFRARRSVSALIGRLRDFGLVLAVLVIFTFSIVAVPAAGALEDLGNRYLFLSQFKAGTTGNLLLGGASFFIIWLGFFMLYSLIPQQRLKLIILVVSSLSAALLWHMAEWIFGYYLTNFLTLNKIYGAYTFLIVVAFWIYYSSLVIILGAEIGQLYREWRHQASVV